MTLSIDVLAVALQQVVPVMDEDEAIQNFANAWEDYFYGAEVLTVAPAPDSLAPATDALIAAMTGLVNLPGLEMAAIQLGITSFWSVLSGIAVSVWTVVPPLASATPPPGLASISAVLTPIGQANIDLPRDHVDATRAIAEGLHPLILGGFAVNTAPIPVSIPIL